MAVKLAFSEKEASFLFKEYEILQSLVGNENIVQVFKIEAGPCLEAKRQD